MSEKYILIDSYGFIFRAFHVQPPLQSPNGEPVGAIYGFASMLIKLLSEQNPTHVAAIFDTGSKSFRNEIYPEYKAHRPDVPEELIKQFPYTRDVAKAFNIIPLEKEGYEADDVIASISNNLSKLGKEVIIVSSDKDLCQLMNDNIKIYDPAKAKFITTDDIISKFGVGPQKIRDVLALMGDKSDNIPGVPGIGPKTAAELITQFNNIENLLINYDQIKSERKRELIKNNIENIKISYELVGLKFDINGDLTPEKLIWNKPYYENMCEFIDKLGFKSLKARINKICILNNVSNPQNILKSPQSDIFSLLENSDKNFTSSNEEIKKLYDIAEEDGILSIYVEDKNIYLASGDSSAVITSDSDTEFFKALEILAEDPSVIKIVYNIKNYRKLFPNIKSYTDIEIMDYILSAGLEKKKLQDIISLHAGKEVNSNIEKVSLFSFLYKKLREELLKNKLISIYEDIDKPISEILYRIEQNGVKFDVNKLHNLSKEFEHKIQSLETEIFKIVGEEFNIGSPKQLSEILFNKLKLPSGKLNQKSKLLSTGADILEKLSLEGFEIADLILKWRHLTKLKNTYTDSIPKLVNSVTSRVHTSYLQTSTTTGRLSSHDPNLQNIPIRTEEGNRIRDAIIPEDGYKILSADYSQIELRILSEIANINVLKNAFKNNIDIHTHTASQIFNLDINEITKEHRRKAKAINFGIIYGISAFGLAKQLNISRSEAKDYIDRYFLEYPGIKKYMDDTIKFANQYGFVTNIYGRKCYVPNITSSNHALKNFGERAAINAPIQGSSADIVKIAMIKIFKFIKEKNLDIKLIMQVHDELVFEIQESDIDYFKSNLKSIMENIPKFHNLLKVDISISNSWFY